MLYHLGGIVAFSAIMLTECQPMLTTYRNFFTSSNSD